MERYPLVSVIIPVYNVEKYLKKCIDSVINQTYSNLEIILVDDGSSDHSREICDEYANNDSRVSVICQQNGGAAVARNKGIDLSKGEYISFIDSDDWIEKTMIETLVNMAINDNTKLCCCGRYDVFGDKKTEGIGPIKNEIVNDHMMFQKIFLEQECDTSTCDKLFHRSLFDDIRYPVGEINEDAALLFAIVPKVDRVSLTNSRLYNYFHRASSVTTSIFSDKKMAILKNADNVKKYIFENYPDVYMYAEYYYVKKVMEICILIDCSNKDVRKQYNKFYMAKIKEIRENIRLLTFGDNLKFMLLYTRTYHLLKPLAKKILTMIKRVH